jgi:type I restriction enzyme S subunit
MSFPRYPAYKDSGVHWLGQIPAHWGVSQSRRMFKVRSEPALPTDRMLTASQKYGVLYQTDFVEREGRRVVEVLLGKESLKHVEPDDFIISMRSFQGGIEWCKLVGSTSFHYVMLTPVKLVHPPFFAHLLKSMRYIEALRTTTDLIRDGQELRFSNFAQVDLPVVPQVEQQAIAEFLDRETAKIDALVAEQEQLITLLKEKRQAVISHAVTKGLDPSVPMKDSGVEWLGEVPEHWQVKQLRHVARIVRGASPRPAGDPKFFSSDESDESNVPWVTVAEITKDDSLYLTEVTEFLTPLGAEASQRFERGTVIFSNSGATLGVPKILAIDCCANDGVVAFKSLDEQVHREFLYFFLSTTTERLRTEMKQGGGQPNLNTDIVKNIGIAVPSLDEQVAVVISVQQQTARFNDLIDEAQRGVALLQERRSALISAAVTGQIDVRGLA